MKKIDLKKFTLASLFENRLFLRILALLIGIVSWYFVVTQISVNQEYRFNVQVDMDSQLESLDRLGLKLVGTPEDRVEVVVRCNRMIGGRLKAENINITAPVTSITAPGTYHLELEGENPELEFVSITPSQIDVKVDMYSSKRLNIEADISGISAPEGFLLEPEVVSPGTVTISGPDEDLAEIASCVVRANVEVPLQKSATLTEQLVLLDANGNEVDQSHITMSTEQAKITVPVLKVKELPLRVKFQNRPALLTERMLSYELSSPAIQVAGPPDQIDSYTELVVGYIDINDLTPEAEYLFEITLPSNFTNVENIENVVVTFDMPQMIQGNFTVEKDNIVLMNLPEEYTATVSTSQITDVIVYGDERFMESMLNGDLVAEVDLSTRDIRPGQHTLPAKVYPPNKRATWVYGDYYVVVNISER